MEILIETQPGMTMVTARSLHNRPGIAAELFSNLGQAGFNVEMITQGSVSDKVADISFAIAQDAAGEAVEHLGKLSGLDVREFTFIKGMGIITVFGHGLVGIPGTAGRVFAALASEGINIEMISTSLSSISVLIKEDQLALAKILLTRELIQDA